MLPDFNRVKGIHPGVILKRELKKEGIRSARLAEEIKEHPQTINAITKERRGINPKLSYKLGNYFNISDDYFMLLQAAFEVSTYKKLKINIENPLKGKFRDSLFWDTRIELIDYQKNKKFIIQRILERGNQQEVEELIKIYSLKIIQDEVLKIENSFIPTFEKNVRKYILSN